MVRDSMMMIHEIHDAYSWRFMMFHLMMTLLLMMVMMMMMIDSEGDDVDVM